MREFTQVDEEENHSQEIIKEEVQYDPLSNKMIEVEVKNGIMLK